VDTEAAGVHDALGDALVVEVNIFSRKWKSSSSDGTALPCPQRVLVVGHRDALLGW
jgi:hypothetical protein